MKIIVIVENDAGEVIDQCLCIPGTKTSLRPSRGGKRIDAHILHEVSIDVDSQPAARFIDNKPAGARHTGSGV